VAMSAPGGGRFGRDISNIVSVPIAEDPVFAVRRACACLCMWVSHHECQPARLLGHGFPDHTACSLNARMIIKQPHSTF
jgi:hypothetical protein